MAHSSSEARELARSRAQVFLDAIIGEASRQEHGESFDYTALSGLTNVRSDGPGHCAAELPVTPKVCNWLHNLHGGCTATLVDTVGTAAIVTISDNPGVSTHIGTEYFAPVAQGDTAVVEATVLQHGKRLCNVEVRVRSKKSGVLVASGMAKVSALVGFNPDVSRRRFPGMPELPPGSTPTAREPSKL